MKEIMKKGQNTLDKKRLFFKIFCYIHPERIMYDSIEATFMFEQVKIIFISLSIFLSFILNLYLLNCLIVIIFFYYFLVG